VALLRSDEPCFRCLADEHAYDGGAHQICDGARKERAHAEAGEFVATVGNERADAADLHAYRAEVCESAESEGGDGECARADLMRVSELTELCVGDELIEYSAGADEVADDGRVVPRNADEPRDGCAEEAENAVQRGWEADIVACDRVHADEVVDAGEDAVKQADECEEADEHDGDVEGELTAVDGAACDGSDEVFVLVFVFALDVDGAEGFRDFCFRHKHFCDEDGARRGHDDGAEKILRADAEGDVRRHDAAGDVRHAAGHDGH